MVLLEKLCFLAQDSAEHLALQAAVHAAHGAVVDAVAHELQRRTRERRVCSGDREKVPAKVHFRGQPQLPVPLVQGPPFSAFHLGLPDLAVVRMDMSAMFRVKAVAEAVLSCRIQSMRRPVKNGMAISPGEGARGIGHRYLV